MPRRQSPSALRIRLLCGLALLVSWSPVAWGQSAAPQARPEPKPQLYAFFGDLHVHTALSMDAFITNTRTMPDDAYRYAKGEPIDHVSGQKVQIDRPLDFMAVTDHAGGLGLAMRMADSASPLSRSPLAAAITSQDYETSHQAFRQVVAVAAGARVGDFDARAWVERVAGIEDDGNRDTAPGAMRGAWQRIIEAAEAHYEPGRFTTFVAYEWTSMPDFANLHRNVVFRGSKVPKQPFASGDSERPEDLWSVLDAWRAAGIEALAIPHNSNASKGLMYPLVDSFGNAVDADYAEKRRRNEPITELTQFKGTSETHTALSPLDELAGFELWNTTVGAPTPVEPVAGSYVRSAYGRGLVLEVEQGFNPYLFGLIGSSDTHNSSSAVVESAFTGGHGNADMSAEVRLDSKPSTLTISSLNFSASGLAGVWAEANTREAIFDALVRRETFATSGPRIRVRFFAGTGFPPDLSERADRIALASDRGVPMGSELELLPNAAPRFFVEALRDLSTAPLDRIQIVKVWAEGGEAREKVFDVRCFGNFPPDAATHRCAERKTDVDLSDCSPSGLGSTQLIATWQDPERDPSRPAAYYVRVLEVPTCRWSTWDALRLGREPPAGVPATIQERAWTSPIWVRPKT